MSEMNLSNFKLLKEDDSHYHIEAPNRNKFRLKKDGLSEKAHGAIKKLCMGGYSDGGDVKQSSDPSLWQNFKASFAGDATDQRKAREDYQHQNQDEIDRQARMKNVQQKAHGGSIQHYDEGTVDAEPVQGIPQSLIAPAANAIAGPIAGPVLTGIATPIVNAIVPQAETAPVAPVAPVAQAPVQDPIAQAKGSASEILSKEQADLENMRRQELEAGNIATGAYNQYLSKMNNQPTPADIYAKYQAKDNELLKAYMDKQIDPDRLHKNQSTGSKILSGIGVILSGMGAGLTHSPNLAIEKMNRAINLDIEAQKNDQSKALNLYKMNHDKLQDETQATMQTQNQLWTGVQAKLGLSAASMKNPEAIQRANQMINQLEMQKIENRKRMALLGGSAAQAGQVDPLLLASDPSIVPNEARQKVTDEIGKAKYAVDNEKQLMEAFEKENEENTILGRAKRGGFQPPSAKTMKLLGIPLLKDNDGRVNENALESFENIMPAPGDRESTINQKREALKNFINLHKSAPTAKSYGIDINNYASTSDNAADRLTGKERAFYDYAKAHPNDPQSKMMLKKLGVK